MTMRAVQCNAPVSYVFFAITTLIVILILRKSPAENPNEFQSYNYNNPPKEKQGFSKSEELNHVRIDNEFKPSKSSNVKLQLVPKVEPEQNSADRDGNAKLMTPISTTIAKGILEVQSVKVGKYNLSYHHPKLVK